MKMPGLAQRNDRQFSNATTTSSLYSLSGSNGSITANGFWSNHHDDVSYNQLQKFWSELSLEARQDLLRIDKQTLFEQARKNMYCSRCNGLLLEGFLQIVMYGKSLQQEGTVGHHPCNRLRASDNQSDGGTGITTGCHDDIQDPSVHPWGGLTTTRDGTLTLLDCYLFSKSLKGLQNVFDSSRARERERELLYPDACGGGGRGWISQGIVGYGRGHGTRETCALHTARLSVDTLVDFWSALGEETRQSLLRMKEEDFIERLMYRFDSKRFCRDCRRNVIREFKELKELKRMRREPRCTSWFCAADTAFQYEVSYDTVQADWHQTFADTVGTYHHFEWAVGTGEGKSDILEFDNVGLSGRVKVNGLDLGGLNACYITLRAWKMDGRCSEISVKAHALKGQQCVHCRLVVGDGFITITRGESIRRFFEHAEEAEEEEDDDSVDKDGNELDGECSRPQKHAKSPELAREFLLDAATVIFKEQVEKAFREGTARQNAHSIFVCLALKLLEERVHVACKEIITLEKQVKLLEEEEKEKREEEERKERRRTKEREKKLRRKERLRGKEKDREKKSSDSYENPVIADVLEEESLPSLDEELSVISNGDFVSEKCDAILSRPLSPDIEDEQYQDMQNLFEDGHDGEFCDVKEGYGSFTSDNSKIYRRKPKFRKDFQVDSTLKWPDRRRFAVISERGGVISKPEPSYHGDNFEFSSRGINGLNKPLRSNIAKSTVRNGGQKFIEKVHCSSCNQHDDCRSKVEQNVSTTRLGRETKSVSKSESVYRGSKYNQTEYTRESCGRPKSKIGPSSITILRDSVLMKQVWEPMESQKKYPRSNSDSDVTLRSSTSKVENINVHCIIVSSDAISSGKVTSNLDEPSREENGSEEPRKSSPVMNGLHDRKKGTIDLSMSSTSNSDNCSSCLSEGDSNTSNSRNLESFSTSDSEDASQNSEGRETPIHTQNGVSESHEVDMDTKQSSKSSEFSQESVGNNFPGRLPGKTAQNVDNGLTNSGMGPQHQGIYPPIHHQSIQFPMFQSPTTMGYYHQTPVSWPPAPPNGLIPFAHPNQYIYASPYGYGSNGDGHFMQYGALPHLTTPPLNPVQVPIYPSIARANGTISQDRTKVSKPHGLQQSYHESNTGRVGPPGPTGDGRPNPNSEKPPMDNPGFSLFHFDGPVALSTGSKSNLAPSNISADQIQSDHHACDEKDTIEQYNLFAASNGLRFSFF